MEGGGSSWPRRWRARWIWWEEHDLLRAVFAASPLRRDGFGYLRTTFELRSAPARATCRITADGRYQLWVNGTRIGRGPVRSEPSHLTYDTYDLGAHLREGVNAVAVLVRGYGEANPHYKPAPPVGTLGLGALLFEAEIDGLLVCSDRSWRAAEAPFRRAEPSGVGGPPPPEIVNGRAVPNGWTEPGFDDSAWRPAYETEAAGPGSGGGIPPCEPFGGLGPRPIPHLAERVMSPVSARGDGGSTVFDMGQIVCGHPRIALEAEAGTVVRLTCGEALDEAGTPVTDVREWELVYTASGRPGEAIEAFEPVGFRYLRTSIIEGNATRLSVDALERTYPREPGSYFRCSDPVLTELWQAGARTLDLCSLDAYIDCPGREQRSWLGDDYVMALVGLVCNPDVRLAAWTQRLHAQGARPDGLLPAVAASDFTDRPVTLPDCSLHWIRTQARLWERTGDRDLVVGLLPVAARILDWFEARRGPDGLLTDLEGWVFIDWAQNERGRQTAVMDALYAMALEDATTLAVVAGDRGLARRCTERARATRRAFGRYWDRRRRVYVDAADPDGSPGRRVSQHTNAVAILSGCAPRSRWDGMLDRVLDPRRVVRTLTPGDTPELDRRLSHQWEDPAMDEEEQVVEAQPFFSHFVHQAVAQAGRAHLIVDLCRRWTPMLERGNGCIEEYWTARPGLGSLCHAWSATPTYDLSTHVLGIRPLHDTVHVNPALGDLDWAEGAVPTPHGPVRGRFGARSWLEVPDRMEAIVAIGGREVRLGPGRHDL
ncbi:MAG TPA: family 78 glycoside hydrolase catalytic domain [Actinomycetota bacterium]|nr:family 78 glycoside hydrolase catalytic domain [Actinomycetota bacterium]